MAAALWVITSNQADGKGTDVKKGRKRLNRIDGGMFNCIVSIPSRIERDKTRLVSDNNQISSSSVDSNEETREVCDAIWNAPGQHTYATRSAAESGRLQHDKSFL